MDPGSVHLVSGVRPVGETEQLVAFETTMGWIDEERDGGLSRATGSGDRRGDLGHERPGLTGTLIESVRSPCPTVEPEFGTLPYSDE